MTAPIWTNKPPAPPECITVPELGFDDCVRFCDAGAAFTDVWLEEEIAPGKWRTTLPGGIKAVIMALASLVEAGELECYARRNDSTRARERIYGLLDCSIVDFAWGVIETPDRTLLYDTVFRHRRRRCRRVMDEIKEEFARRYSAGECSDRLSWDARELLAWAKATLEPTEGGFPEETTVRVTLTNYRKELAGLA